MKIGRKLHAPASTGILLILMILGGCQAIFTYTPLKGFQRDPSSLSPEQRLVYAQDALASGDKAAMLAAYNAIKADAGNDASHLTAELGIELSGVPGLINSAITDQAVLTGSGTTIADYIAAHPGLDPTLIIDAGIRMQNLDAAGYPLSTNDRILGAIGLALEAAQTINSSYDLTGLTPVDLSAAIALIAPLVGSDTFANSLNTYLQNP
jgi:hypothetical protein